MMHGRKRTIGIGGIIVLAGALGCGGTDSAKGPATYQIEGVVLRKDGAPYTDGGSIEFRHTTNPDFKSYGQVKDDGAFSLRTLGGNNQNLAGAQEGDYRVTIIPDPTKKQELQPIVLSKTYSIKAGDKKITVTLEK